ncbi:esterase lipase [Fusarium pseudoanthophilum]|uniref:Esterase lipase n=1 Tax=Fusarium pseudoanthophilum TaxID=48495 RepID=A0A8H5PPE1_9HYPO|nr:esterase lipase [Fusarium pseudoanthophilum]
MSLSDVASPMSSRDSSGKERPPQPRDVILCGYLTAYKFLQDIHNLDRVDDWHVTVEKIHETILTNVANRGRRLGLDYLAGRGDVDPKGLFLVGVCQGGPECLYLASYDDRVVAVASVTSIEPGIDEKTGQVTYQPLVDPKAADPDVGSLAGLTGPVAWSWYGPWTLNGFENRYAVISDLDHFGYSTVPGVAKLTKPALVIHGDKHECAPAKRHFESIPTDKKKLIWDDDVSHFQHYDQPDVVDNNVGEIAAWFAHVEA